MKTPASRHVLFFDHDCLLCNGTVKFLMARDGADVLRFAPLQGATAAEIFRRHPQLAQDPAALESIVLAENHGGTDERMATRSTAVARALRRLGGGWWLAGALLALIPRPLRDWGYAIVARNRLRWFGVATPDTCPLPTAEEARKLLP